MKTPSRRIYSAPEHKMKPVVYLLLAIIVLVLIYLCASSPVVLMFFTVLFIVGFVAVKVHRKKLRKIAETRHDESICTFAKSFDCRNVDTWIIRATYEELQKYLKTDFAGFPIHKTDSLEKLLGIDPEDICDIVFDIAARAGYDMKNAETNPLFGKVQTIEDLVMFFTHQPKSILAQPDGYSREGG